MKQEYPMHFTLEDGTHVEVSRVESDKYAFALTTEKGVQSHFMYVDDDEPRMDKEAGLTFDQLNALRVYWLKTHDVV